MFLKRELGWRGVIWFGLARLFLLGLVQYQMEFAAQCDVYVPRVSRITQLDFPL